MLNDTQIKILNEVVKKNLDNNREMICQAITEGVKDVGITQIYPQMIMNALNLSVSLSVQIVMEFLDNEDIIHISDDERLLTRLKLSVVSTDRETDDQD